MIVEVFAGRLYIIFIAKDRDDKVLGVLPVSARDFFRKSTDVKGEIKKFFRKVDRLPPSRVVFHKNMPFIMKMVAETLRELDEELKREYEEEIKKMREKAEKIRSTQAGKIKSLQNSTSLLEKDKKVQR